jgi:hypothetical protein
MVSRYNWAEVVSSNIVKARQAENEKIHSRLLGDIDDDCVIEIADGRTWLFGVVVSIGAKVDDQQVFSDEYLYISGPLARSQETLSAEEGWQVQYHNIETDQIEDFPRLTFDVCADLVVAMSNILANKFRTEKAS